MHSRPVGGAPQTSFSRTLALFFHHFCFDSSLTKLVEFASTEMALKRPFPEEDFLCPVCCGVFSDPVVLQCGHSGCKKCLDMYWSSKGSRECPLCRKVSANSPPFNTSLRNLCQTFLDYKHHLEEYCEVHQDVLRLYCCDDEQLVCERCRDSEEHRKHTCRPVGEVAEERKVLS